MVATNYLRQVSDKPQGRKLQEIQARYFGKHSLSVFEGLAMVLAGREAVLMTVVWCVDANKLRLSGGMSPDLVIDLT